MPIRISPAEWEVLNVLWDKAPATAPEVHAALPVFLEGARAAQKLGGFLLDEGEAHILGHALRERLTVEFIQLRLRIEEIHLRRTPHHEERNHRLRLP